jgi:hypothetical protein
MVLFALFFHSSHLLSAAFLSFRHPICFNGGYIWPHAWELEAQDAVGGSVNDVDVAFWSDGDARWSL